MNIFVGLIIFVYIYFVSHNFNNCLEVQLRSAHPKTLEVAGSKPPTERTVLNLSAPEILQRPAPQPGAPLFGAPRPERPSAPANPAPDLSRRPTGACAATGSVCAANERCPRAVQVHPRRPGGAGRTRWRRARPMAVRAEIDGVRRRHRRRPGGPSACAQAGYSRSR